MMTLMRFLVLVFLLLPLPANGRDHKQHLEQGRNQVQSQEGLSLLMQDLSPSIMALYTKTTAPAAAVIIDE